MTEPYEFVIDPDKSPADLDAAVARFLLAFLESDEPAALVDKPSTRRNTS